MKLVLAAVLALGGLTANVETSFAMSIAPTTSGASSLAQDVRWGCGYGWHPNPWGRCVPDGGPVYYGWHRPIYYGYHSGYGGWHRWHHW